MAGRTKKGIPLKIFLVLSCVIFIASTGISYSIFSRENPLKDAHLAGANGTGTGVADDDMEGTGGGPEMPAETGEEASESAEETSPDEEISPGEEPAPSSAPEPADTVAEEPSQLEEPEGDALEAEPEPEPKPKPKTAATPKKVAAKPKEAKAPPEKRKFVREEVKKIEFTLKIQIGTYGSEKRMMRDLERVQNLGFETFSREDVVEENEYFLVLGGKMPSGAAKANSLKLRAMHKIENEVVPQPDGTAQVRIGPLGGERQLADMQRKVEEAGFTVQTDVKKKFNKQYVLGVGPFYTSRELSEAEAVLKENGFRPQTGGM